MSDFDVVIVGGGPCGLLTSLLLARYGLTSLVIERHPDISIHPKAMGITRRTGEIYRQLGIYNRMIAADVTNSEYSLAVWSKGLVGEELGRTPLMEGSDEFTPCARFHCPQPHTEAVIARELQEKAEATVWHYKKVTGFEETDDGVRVDCIDLATEKSISATGRFLIAADGAASPIREMLGIEVDGPGDMGHFINTYFRANYGPHLTDRKAILYNALGNDFAEFFVTVNGHDLWLMHHYLNEGECLDDYSESRMTETIKQASGLPDESVEIISMLGWVMSPKLSRQWRRGRCLLVGDSAARLSPSGGFGMNTGLQGAHNLAWKLAAVLKGLASDSLLDTYESERRGAARFTMDASTGNSQEIFSIVGSALQGDWPSVKDQISHSRRVGSVLGLDIGLRYEAGALVEDGTEAPEISDPINDYAPSGRPGSRAPHIWLAEGQSILDLFGLGFTVLAGPGGAGWKAAMDDAEWPLGYFLAADFHLIDHSDFLSHYGVQSDGVVLVRPDGYIAARIPSLAGSDASQLVQAARQVLFG